MELFLSTADSNGLNLEEIAHETQKLYSWGPLDSVLRMLKRPSDMMSEPERFLSYFISPPPPVKVNSSTLEAVEFEVPISSDQYPLTASYLRCAFECLPAFVGRPMAQSTWEENKILINWGSGQEDLFKDDTEEPVMNPKLIDTVIANLEKSQKDLESRNQELLLKNAELESAQKQLQENFQEKVYLEKLSNLSELAMALSHEINNPMAYVKSNVFRFKDYMVRAQQIIQILYSSMTKKAPANKIMKKLDWEFVQKEYPEVIEEAVTGLHKIQGIVEDLSCWAGSSQVSESPKEQVDIDAVVGSAVKMLSPNLPSNVSIETVLGAKRKVSGYSGRLEQALIHLMEKSVASLHGKGKLMVKTYEDANQSTVEIEDPNGILKHYASSDIVHVAGQGNQLSLGIANSIVKMHRGELTFDENKYSFKLNIPIH